MAWEVNGKVGESAGLQERGESLLGTHQLTLPWLFLAHAHAHGFLTHFSTHFWFVCEGQVERVRLRELEWGGRLFWHKSLLHFSFLFFVFLIGIIIKSLGIRSSSYGNPSFMFDRTGKVLVISKCVLYMVPNLLSATSPFCWHWHGPKVSESLIIQFY